jgi:3-methylcrotonyl-CoA carboxylase alpha subunit
LDRALHEVYEPALTLPVAVQISAALAEHHWLAQHRSSEPYSPWNDAYAWRIQGADTIALRMEYRAQTHARLLRKTGAGWCITLPEHGEVDVYDVQLTQANKGVLSIQGKHRAADGVAHLMTVEVRSLGIHGLEVHDGKRRYRLQKPDAQRSRGHAAAQSDVIRAPMPGRIVAIKSAVESAVSEGQELLIMEAMKMELSLKAAQAGKVAEVRCKVGDFVEADSILIKLAS